MKDKSYCLFFFAKLIPSICGAICGVMVPYQNYKMRLQNRTDKELGQHSLHFLLSYLGRCAFSQN
jgi:hypothetical protein